MHLPATTLLSLFLSLSLASAHAPIPNPPHRRHLVRIPKVDRSAVAPAVVLARAGAAYSNGTLASISEADAYSSAHPSTVSSVAATTSAPTSTQAATTADDTQSSIVQSTPDTSAAASVVTTATPSTFAESDTAISTLPTSVIPVSTVAPTSVELSPTTISQVSQVAAASTVTNTQKVSVVTATKTASTSSTASAAASKNGSSEKSGGLSKTALIAIIVVASVVGLAGIGWTVFRKWKLKPSNRFDERMKPIDFSPHNDGRAPDFLEKTLHRTASNASADRQRQQFVAELDDPNHVPGVPEHDFTAGSNQAGYGAYNTDVYNADPFAHAQSYEYDQGYYGQEHAYPPAPVQYEQEYAQHGHHQEYPTQDPEEGYADLQRGNSDGSNHARGQQQVYPTDFPSPEAYIGRPTGGSDGPYAQAAQYRTY